MFRFRLLAPCLCAALVCIAPSDSVQEAVVVVTPTDLQGWAPANVRTDAWVDITGTQPHGGDGSLEFGTITATPGQDKADFELLWTPDPARTLGALDSLSYEYFRDASSTTAAHFHPVLRVYFYLDQGTPNTSDDVLGLLIFEEIYQPAGNVPLDTWDANDLMSANMWMYISVSPSGTGVVQNYHMTLADWLANTDPTTSLPPVGQPGDPTPAALGADTAIVGVNVGVGSGWGATFLGFVDTVTIGFGGEADTYNFDLTVPVTLQSFSVE